MEEWLESAEFFELVSAYRKAKKAPDQISSFSKLQEAILKKAQEFDR